jgi:hypothetical protein
LARAGRAAPLLVDGADHPGVVRAVRSLQADVRRVSGAEPKISFAVPGNAADAVVIGTVGKSALVDGLVKAGKLDVKAIAGRWEAFLSDVVEQPWPGVRRALVIAGSDKRGTIYGVYQLSRDIGVSPWYWWADVPVRRRATVLAPDGRRVDLGPAIKYRGIFLNDEAPALAGWAKEKFGGLNHLFYERLFELMLRLRANYLWPAMWANAFNEDDPENARLADEYGIVMGTSHHEPMLRAQQEWKRHGKGAWNYASNGAELRAFWTEGIRRNAKLESIVTLGMRGDGDMPMSAKSDVPLLERIVTDQRKILAENVRPDVERIPQLWALYKEVQAYYDLGMKVPDDVTLLFSDDNWGNLRRLPTAAERARAGGAGIYYHLDYVGDPRSYKWVDTVPISKVWEQMHLAWSYGADRIWIVNVGDLKPLELPTEFFLTYAWAPERWPYQKLGEFTRAWAAREFGVEHAGEIAAIVDAYTKLNGRRKPELLAPDTFSLVDYHEAETVVGEWQALVGRAEAVARALPRDARDAFFELVLYPVKACANLNQLYVTVGRNRWYALQGRASTNAMAEQARALFKADADLAREYNQRLAGGKWRHMMDQTHIGYTYWQQPPANVLPAISEVQLQLPAQRGAGRERGPLAVSLEGRAAAWPTDNVFEPPPALPPIDAYEQQTRTIEVFTRGRQPGTFSTETSDPWLRVVPPAGTVPTETRLTVSADWAHAPTGRHDATVTIRGAGERPIVITVLVIKPPPPAPARDQVAGFVETGGGVVSIEAEHWSQKVDAAGVEWQVLPAFGRTLSGVTPFPVTAPSQTPSAGSPRLEYRVYLASAGDASVDLYLAPSLDFVPRRALRCAVSFDDAPPVTLEVSTSRSQEDWSRAVADSVRKLTTRQRIAAAGAHVLKFWMVDPGVVLERLVIETAPGAVHPSYLGPPETFHR